MLNRLLALCSCLTLMLVSGSKAQYVQTDGSPGPDLVVARAMLGVLSRTHVSGSLEYVGQCPQGRLPDFPTVDTSLKSSDETPLQAFNEMFKSVSGLQVKQEANGTIRIIGHEVPVDLLDVKVEHISFDVENEIHTLGDKGIPILCSVQPPSACESIQVLKTGCSTGKCITGAYDAPTALGAILRTPEVQSFVKAHGIELGTEHGSLFEGIAFPSTHHISGDLDNVTVSQALDYVLKAFPGFWVYELCPVHLAKREVLFAFFTYR